MNTTTRSRNLVSRKDFSSTNRYLIYHTTIYEAADAFDELLEIYTSANVKIRYTDQVLNINGFLPRQVYRYYRGKAN